MPKNGADERVRLKNLVFATPAQLRKHGIRFELIPEEPHEPQLVWLGLYYRNRRILGNGCYQRGATAT